MGSSGASRDGGTGRSLLEFQLVMFASIIIVGTAALAASTITLDAVLFTSGAAFVALVTVATLVWRSSPSFQRAALLVPLADVVGLRLMVLSDTAALSAQSLLLILPIIWVAYSFGLNGILACIGVVLITNPMDIVERYLNTEGQGYSRIVSFLLILLILAVVAGVTGSRTRQKRVQLEIQTALTEEAVLTRDALVEAVNHELRTPLASILGNAELVLRNRDTPEPVQRRASAIVRNVEQMETIMSDLLRARSTANEPMALDRTSSDIRLLVCDSIAAIQPMAAARRVTIALDPTGDAPWAPVDPARIRQVLDNLLSNAVKYNRRNGTVHVAVAESVGSGTITLAVTDTGLGIPEAERARVFDRHYRAESARNSPERGSGLGLGISRDIARQHGGDLRVVPWLGGSRFELTLPLCDQPARG